MKKNHLKRTGIYLKYKFRHKKERIVSVLLWLAILWCILLILLCMKPQKLIIIEVKVKDSEMIVEEEKPEFSVEMRILDEETLKKKINKNDKYMLETVVRELKDKTNFSFLCEGDGKTEGVYRVTVNLDERIQKQLREEWKGRIVILTASGKLTVNNKIGFWEGDKFKNWEGNALKEQFIESQGDVYYLDEKGEKTVGWTEIKGSRYYFDEDGSMQKGFWEEGEDKYYFDKEGKRKEGWLEIDEKIYYFDREGKMKTGVHVIGMQECIFHEDGELIEKKGLQVEGKPLVALTFDDGPGVHTEKLLKVLEENGARATFFVVGRNIEKYEETIMKMKEIGCEIGNHTATHKRLIGIGLTEVTQEIETVNQLLETMIEEKTRLFRPPYGAINQQVREQAEAAVIMWSLDTQDWETRDVDSTLQTVFENVKDGDIILMHDIHEESVEAAIQMIPKLIEEGYQLVTVSEMAKIREIELKNSEKYSSFYP